MCLVKAIGQDIYFSIHKPIIIQGDNQIPLKLATNPACHGRTKHIENEHHFIRAKVLDGSIGVMEVLAKITSEISSPSLFLKVHLSSFELSLI